MSELRTDEEQAEIIKKWWSENGTSLLTTIAVAVAGVVGWNTWQDNKQVTGEAASAVYTQLVELSAQDSDANSVEMQTLAEQLKGEFADTAYGDFGGLFIARIAADKGDFDAAATELKALADTAENPAVKSIAQARLASVLNEQGKADEALAALPAKADAAFAPQIEEARGDALFLKGELADARDAYLRAMEAAQTLGQTNNTLQRKIDSLKTGGDA
jgi:predicted negative regulator of RcsB-dependent stress response